VELKQKSPGNSGKKTLLSFFRRASHGGESLKVKTSAEHPILPPTAPKEDTKSRIPTTFKFRKSTRSTARARNGPMLAGPGVYLQSTQSVGGICNSEGIDTNDLMNKVYLGLRATSTIGGNGVDNSDLLSTANVRQATYNDSIQELCMDENWNEVIPPDCKDDDGNKDTGAMAMRRQTDCPTPQRMHQHSTDTRWVKHGLRDIEERPDSGTEISRLSRLGLERRYGSVMISNALPPAPSRQRPLIDASSHADVSCIDARLSESRRQSTSFHASLQSSIHAKICGRHSAKLAASRNMDIKRHWLGFV